MSSKILYVASTAGHLKSFHLPYLSALSQMGWTVHIAGKGAGEGLPGAERGFDIPFEKSMFSPKNLAAVGQLVRLLRRERYQAISVHTALAAFFLRLAVMLSGCRRELVVINTVHGYLFDGNTPWPKRTILLAAEKMTAGATDLLLTMNRQDTQIAGCHRLCRGEVLQIKGMGVDFGRFTPATAEQRRQARERFQLPQDAFVLVYAAEFSKRKNQGALLRALAVLPEQVWLLLAGGGGTLAECQRLAQELQVTDRVVFAG
jgi:glycosyltransferase EpsD